MTDDVGFGLDAGRALADTVETADCVALRIDAPVSLAAWIQRGIIYVTVGVRNGTGYRALPPRTKITLTIRDLCGARLSSYELLASQACVDHSWQLSLSAPALAGSVDAQLSGDPYQGISSAPVAYVRR